jgi:guanylate kinase
LCPPSISVLKQRLLKRGTETDNSLKVRLANAEREIAECFKLDRILNIRIVNADFDDAYNLLENIVKAVYSQELAHAKA